MTKPAQGLHPAPLHHPDIAPEESAKLLPYVAIGAPLALPPPLPRSAPMADRYAQLLAAILAQQTALEQGTIHPFPQAYLFEAYHYVRFAHAVAQRARSRRLGKPFPKTPRLQPANAIPKPSADPLESKANDAARKLLEAFLAGEEATLESGGASPTELLHATTHPTPEPPRTTLSLKNFSD